MPIAAFQDVLVRPSPVLRPRSCAPPPQRRAGSLTGPGSDPREQFDEHIRPRLPGPAAVSAGSAMRVAVGHMPNICARAATPILAADHSVVTASRGRSCPRRGLLPSSAGTSGLKTRSFPSPTLGYSWRAACGHLCSPSVDVCNDDTRALLGTTVLRAVLRARGQSLALSAGSVRDFA